jgi:hypothetical protein
MVLVTEDSVRVFDAAGYERAHWQPRWQNTFGHGLHVRPGIPDELIVVGDNCSGTHVDIVTSGVP